MGIRSYLLTEQNGACTQRLEANNQVPLLWVALLDTGAVQRFERLPNLFGVDASAAGTGLRVPLVAALANLARRRPLLARWIGAPAGVVADQLGELLRSAADSPGTADVVLDVGEYVDAEDSPEAALAFFAKAVDALDSDAARAPQATRRPPKIKWLMDTFGLSGVADDATAFGRALAGGRADDSEPWYREPPRPRRVPGEWQRWSNTDLVLAPAGTALVANFKNGAHLNTPVIWRLDDGGVTVVPVPDAIGELFPYAASADGRTVVGDCRVFPGARHALFRCVDGRIDTLPCAPGTYWLVGGVSADASVAALTVRTKGEWTAEQASRRAARLHDGVPEPIGPVEAPSEAAAITPDGECIAGVVALADGERPFVWTVGGGFETVGPAATSHQWRALAPDGGSGVLAIRSGPDTGSRLFHWRRGAPPRELDDLANAGFAAVSRAADAVAAEIAGEQAGDIGVVVWTLAAGATRLALDELGPLRSAAPVFVADGGDSCVLRVEAADRDRADRMVVWRRGAGLQACPAGTDARGERVFLELRCAGATLADLVVPGRRPRDGAPVVWTLAQGVVAVPFERS